jgi:hypothetical protein
MVARLWEKGVLTVKTEERGALAAMNPKCFFWTARHGRSPLLILARLDRVNQEELGELLAESHRLAGGRNGKRR